MTSQTPGNILLTTAHFVSVHPYLDVMKVTSANFKACKLFSECFNGSQLEVRDPRGRLKLTLKMKH